MIKTSIQSKERSMNRFRLLVVVSIFIGSMSIGSASHVAVAANPGGFGVTAARNNVISASQNGRFACAITTDGRVKCWGANLHGQLGLGDTADRGDGPNEMGDNLPTVNLGTGRTATAVSVGGVHVCAILDNSSVKCWGYNGGSSPQNGGELGLGDTANRGDGPNEMGDNLPTVDLGTGRTATAIAAGLGHTCAILDNGSVKCWGYQSSDGRMGYGDNRVRGDGPNEMGDNLPTVDLGTGRTAISISAGAAHTCVVLDNNKVKCWGLNFAGQLGLGDTANRGDAANEMGDNLPTVDLGTGRTAISISAGSNHTCSLLDDNSVKCWGDNTNGQLGLGDTNARGDGASEMGNSLGVVPLGVAATSVIASDTTTCATINGGQLKCWGANVFGQLGIGSTNSQGDGSGEIAGLAAVNLGTGRTAIGVAPGYEFTCALLDDQSLKCWGRNGIGELGIGTAEGGIIGDHAIGDTAGEMGNSLTAVNLTTSFPVASMALTQWSSCAMFVNGKVKCWGRSHYGQLGYEDLLTRGDGASEMGENLPFVNLGTGRTAVSITSGWAHVCVLLDNGSVKCWGYNSDGELGIGDAIEKGLGAGQMGDNLVAVNLGTGRTAVAISAGEYHTCAILNGGDVKCWGRNDLGQLGLGDTNNRGDGSGEMGDNLPVVNLGSGRTAVSISGGQYHTCARLDNNTLKCWGHSGDGALGYGDTATRGDDPNEMGENLPVVNVGLGRTVVMVKAGATHSCAILDNDGLKCWGDNFFGELGQGDTNSR
ncbi:MAG: hypothetical protein EBZ93_08405, partial [Actinobacteria bacterium]|nr:hypothetical protein [Actinomycetota bacterium]